jgi:hypothetical protein
MSFKRKMLPGEILKLHFTGLGLWNMLRIPQAKETLKY